MTIVSGRPRGQLERIHRRCPFVVSGPTVASVDTIGFGVDAFPTTDLTRLRTEYNSVRLDEVIGTRFDVL